MSETFQFRKASYVYSQISFGSDPRAQRDLHGYGATTYGSRRHAPIQFSAEKGSNLKTANPTCMITSASSIALRVSSDMTRKSLP